jgi:hypothetical protein
MTDQWSRKGLARTAPFGALSGPCRTLDLVTETFQRTPRGLALTLYVELLDRLARISVERLRDQEADA